MHVLPESAQADNSRKIWLVRAVATVGGVVVLAGSASIVSAAVSAGAGIATLLSIAIGGFAALQALPLALQKLENRLLKSRKHEARANPIEQLQNEVMRRAERLQAFRRALVTVGGQIESIEQLLADRKHRDPTHMLERQDRALLRLQEFHRANLARLGQTQEALKEFQFTVERKESEWRIALAISDANDKLDPNSKDNLLQDLLTDTALRSVQERFNTVFADLDLQMNSFDSTAGQFLNNQNQENISVLEPLTQNLQRSKS